MNFLLFRLVLIRNCNLSLDTFYIILLRFSMFLVSTAISLAFFVIKCKGQKVSSNIALQLDRWRSTKWMVSCVTHQKIKDVSKIVIQTFVSNSIQINKNYRLKLWLYRVYDDSNLKKISGNLNYSENPTSEIRVLFVDGILFFMLITPGLLKSLYLPLDSSIHK